MSDIAGHDDFPEITLGWRLRIAMERAEIKADDMAQALGVHRGTITRWTHDIGSPPRAIYLEKWADICRVPEQWLRGEFSLVPLFADRGSVGGAVVVGDADNSRDAGRDTHRHHDLSAELAAA